VDFNRFLKIEFNYQNSSVLIENTSDTFILTSIGNTIHIEAVINVPAQVSTHLKESIFHKNFGLNRNTGLKLTYI